MSTETSMVEQNRTSHMVRMPGQMIHRARGGKAGAMELEHEWAVILAGGDGTRLKSLSRKITGDERPKQFCPVFGDMTLLEETQRRVAIELARANAVCGQPASRAETGPRIRPNGRCSTALDGKLLKPFGSQRRLDGPLLLRITLCG